MTCYALYQQNQDIISSHIAIPAGFLYALIFGEEEMSYLHLDFRSNG